MQDYLSTPEAAVIIGVSTATLRRLRGAGMGPIYVKIGRRVIYRRTDLDAWMRSLRIEVQR
jgi:excisionase family DNA binding protein